MGNYFQSPKIYIENSNRPWATDAFPHFLLIYLFVVLLVCAEWILDFSQSKWFLIAWLYGFLSNQAGILKRNYLALVSLPNSSHRFSFRLFLWRLICITHFFSMTFGDFFFLCRTELQYKYLHWVPLIFS